MNDFLRGVRALMDWCPGLKGMRGGGEAAAVQPRHSLDSRAPCTYSLGPSIVLSADTTSGSLEGDVAKGCTQGVKLNIFSRLNQEWAEAMPLALRRMHSLTRSYVHAEFI